MTTLFKKAALTSVLALSFGLSAHAATAVGDLSDGWGDYIPVTAKGNFTDYYNFSLDVASGATGLAAQSLKLSSTSGISLSSVSLYNGSFSAALTPTVANLISSVSNPSTSVGAYNLVLTLPSLAANTAYTLVVAGNAVSANAGYTAQIALSPVPEPETYAMLLAGLGVMGFVARRRQKSNKA